MKQLTAPQLLTKALEEIGIKNRSNPQTTILSKDECRTLYSSITLLKQELEIVKVDREALVVTNLKLTKPA